MDPGNVATTRAPQRGMGAPDVAAFADALDGLLQQTARVLLTGPIDPDGDSIGACLALAVGIRQRHPAVTVHVAGNPGNRYAWMAGADAMLPDAQVRPDYDLVMVLDGDRHRLEAPVDAAFKAARFRAIVDHHGSTGEAGYDLHLLDRTAASTCQMVYPLLQLWSVSVDLPMAELLYTGIIFDTGGFRHSNTTPATHRLAARLVEIGVDQSAVCIRVLSERSFAGVQLLGHVLQRSQLIGGGRVAIGSVPHGLFSTLGASYEDLEGVVDALLHIRGVEVACLFIEKEPERVKLSLRSRREVDVAAIAARLSPNGGGHARAAGALLLGPLQAALDRVPAVLEAAARP